MQTLLIATGEEKKLAPLTAVMPSPMLPVVNRPVMALAVELLARQGVKEISVALYDRGEQIERYFRSGARWGVQLDYRLQREAWGDGGAIKWAASYLQSTTLVAPADIIAELDVTALAHFHQTHHGRLTAVLHPSDTMPPTCPVWLRPDGALSLTPIAEEAPYSLTGVYLVEPGVVADWPLRTHFTLAGDVLPRLIGHGEPVYGYVLDAYWNPLDTFARYQAAQTAFLTAVQANGRTPAAPTPNTPRHPRLDSQRMGAGVWVGKQNAIHPTVRLRPPVLIGDNCQIGRDVELGPYAVIGHNVVIADEATIQHSTVLDNTYVGQLVNVDGRVVQKGLLIDIASAESTAVTDAFLLGESGSTAVGVDVARLVDIVVALTLGWWLWPLLVILALVALVSNGRFFHTLPIVGKSARTGQRATFSRLNFALPDWLTRWQLHRLAELWNLGRGDMTLVGVKPLTPAAAAQVTEVWQEQRDKHPAGLTGLWYVQLPPDAALDDVLMADAYYVATRTWRTDAKIILQTPKVWLQQITNS